MASVHQFSAPALLVSLVACGGDGVSFEPPTIRAFTVNGASTAQVVRGEPVTLAWSVVNASSVQISLDPGGVLQRGQARTGQLVTPPILEATRISLTAIGPGGDAMKSVTVTLSDSDDVVIESFAATPSVVDPGDGATLSWQVRNADAIRIDRADGVSVIELGPRLEGTVNVTPPVTSSYVLWAAGRGGPVTETVSVEVQGSPAILEFVARPSEVTLGEEVTLSWSVENADLVRLLDDEGAVLASGSDAIGSHRTQPVEDSEYRLVVSAEGFPDVEASAPVTVVRPEGARILSFSAEPSEVLYGRPATLRWNVENAPGGIELAADGQLLVSTSELSGDWTVTPTKSAEYVLQAKNAQKGDNSARRTITVTPASPAIERFAVTPNPVVLGDPIRIDWRVVGASDVQIEVDGLVLDTTGAGSAGQVGTGTISHTISSTAANVRLLASNPYGTVEQSTLVTSTRLPIIDRFVVQPSTLTGPVTATVSWTVRNATSMTVRLDASSLISVPTPSTISGSIPVQISDTSHFTLEAVNAIGSSTGSAWVARLDGEVEPNASPAEAQALAGDGSGVLGQMSSESDVDVYAVYIPDGGSVWARLCGSATDLELIGPNAQTSVGRGAAVSGCLEIRAAEGFNFDLEPGTYFLAVATRPGTFGGYQLTVRADAPACGNGLLERRAGETCDDANQLGGDGCSPQCLKE